MAIGNTVSVFNCSKANDRSLQTHSNKTVRQSTFDMVIEHLFNMSTVLSNYALQTTTCRRSPTVVDERLRRAVVSVML